MLPPRGSYCHGQEGRAGIESIMTLPIGGDPVNTGLFPVRLGIAVPLRESELWMVGVGEVEVSSMNKAEI